MDNYIYMHYLLSFIGGLSESVKDGIAICINPAHLSTSVK